MKRSMWLISGFMLVGLLVGGIWLWQVTFKGPTIKVPTTQTISSASSSLDQSGNFLSIDRVPGITLSSILDQSFVVAAGSEKAKLITIVTTGDIIPARGVDVQIRTNGPDYPFANQGITNLLSQADLTVVDLESPLTSGCPVTKTGFTFCGQPSFAKSMAKNGIDVATLENNHIGNYGSSGIAETKQLLTEAGIRFATDTDLDIETVRGYKIGLLAFNGVGGKFYPEVIKTRVVEAKSKVDILLVAYHWGKEYEPVPTADPSIAPDDPQDIGRMTIDAGADVVIGNHPHWVQGVEVYKGKLISYALGNFIFDQSWSTETMQGMVASYTFYGPKLIGASFTPIHIYNQAQPRIADTVEAKTIFNQFKQSSLLIAGLGK